MAATLACDIPNWQELPQYVATQEVNKILGQRGFCFINGFADNKVKRLAEKEARELRKANELVRTPRQACCALLGESSSCWTRRLGDPAGEAPQPDAEKEANLLKLDDCLTDVGGAIALGSQLFFGEIVARHRALLHYSRMPEDKPAPRLVDPEEADTYMAMAVAKKVALLYYIGPAPATLTMTPRDDPKRVYKVTTKGNVIVAYRTDVCLLTLDTKGIGITVEADYIMRSKQSLQGSPTDILPMPTVLDDWYLERLRAIVEEDMYDEEDIPLHVVRDAVTTFFKSSPVRVISLWHELPTLPTFGGEVNPFEATLLQGQDVVTEICKTRQKLAYYSEEGDAYSWGGKWDPDEYYAEDQASSGDFKMYTRHLSVLNRGHEAQDDYDVRVFGITAAENTTLDHRARMLLEAHVGCMKKANFDSADTKLANIGIYSGLSGENQLYHFMFREAKINKYSSANASNATMVNRLSYYLGCNGPCICVDTGDSSSSSALDAAVSGLREKRSEPIAFASGCQWISNPFETIMQCAAGVISPSGRTRVFDESADGFNKGEGVVTAQLELHDSPTRAESKKKTGLQKHSGGEPIGVRALILGTGMNSKGTSSSISAPSGPSLRDVVARAARDARVPVAIMDAVEVSAAGHPLSDSIEWATLAQVLKDPDRNHEQAVMLRAIKAVYGNLGPVNGLASLTRTCALMERGLHSPMLHLRTLLATCDDDPWRCRMQVLSELCEARFHSQVVGVSSFSSTGTNCHHVLWGSKLEEKKYMPEQRPITWWPGGSHKEANPPLQGYYVCGTWSAWEQPCLMQEESEGVFGYTLTMGENNWELFQIWLDGDSERALHPISPGAQPEALVEGPSLRAPRELSWQVSGRPEHVRLINEEQEQALVQAGAEAQREAEKECRIQVTYEDNYLPPGHEDAKGIEDMPLVQVNAQVGQPGDKYRIRLHVRGKYKRVEWCKAVGMELVESKSEELAYVHKYQVIGDHSYWSFEDMSADPTESGLYRATIQLLKETSNFQIFRDRDWEQGMYPKAAEGGAEAAVGGPDGLGHGRNWQITGKVGDHYNIEFRRRSTGNLDEKSVTWEFHKSGEADFVELSKSHRYFLIGSSTGFETEQEMERDLESGHFSTRVVIGQSNKEEFQILLNSNWLAAVHPNICDATMNDDGHTLQGPDDAGDGMYWVIGQEAKDQDQVVPGTHFMVHLEMEGGLPKRVWWEKTENPDENREHIAWGCRKIFERHQRLLGFAQYESPDKPGRLVTRQPFMEMETVRGQLPYDESAE
mmetsp:Transcript_59161/g.152155  ORF Transcript_59161/g.152155 Transcript_59161/m.152155 type:complete len:1274 (-) Transcript_59161:140-3961(-)